MPLYKHTLPTILVAALAMGLSACAQSPLQNGDPTKQSAATFGLYSDQNRGMDATNLANNPSALSYKKIINSMQAPSEQTYYFAFDSVKMDADDIQALQVQAQYLLTHKDAHILLEGNADSRGSREYNIGLGWRRDRSVDTLLLQYGVKPAQISKLSFGKERPAVPGDGPQAWALNRRVHLVYEEA